MDRMKANLEGGNVKGAQRLQATWEGVRMDSEYVVIDFKDEMTSKKVTLCFQSYSEMLQLSNVWPYSQDMKKKKKMF